MNERIHELAKRAGFEYENYKDIWFLEGLNPSCNEELKRFAELIVAKVLDEVAERAYICGDRAWSDEMDRRWVELEFGFGELAELKNDQNDIC